MPVIGTLLTMPTLQLLPLNFDYSIMLQPTDRLPVWFSSPVLYTGRPFLILVTSYLFSEPLRLPPLYQTQRKEKKPHTLVQTGT